MEQGSTGLGEGAARPRERKGPSSPIYSVELEVFEGPLDLLLHLVRKHELDILDIPIAFVAEKYLHYLDVMRQLDLEIAGDYLVMAATLAYLKSRELLPSIPRVGQAGESEEDDGEDPREALIRRLVEYERFKQAAAELDALPMAGRDVFARGADLVMPPVDPGLQPVSLFNLAEAYYRVLTRAKVKSSHDVTIEAVTVAQRIQQLALMLDERPSFDFEDLFLGRTWNSEKELRTMLVVTLMSILEMVKLGVAGVQQPLDSTTIRIYRIASAEQAQRALADYDEDVSFGTREAPQAPDATGEGDAPAAPTRATEAELDAVEEATLLAEALAGVQEPEDPVLGYEGEGEGEAANDSAVGGDADADARAAARFGEAVRSDRWYPGVGVEEPARSDLWGGARIAELELGEDLADVAPVIEPGGDEIAPAGEEASPAIEAAEVVSVLADSEVVDWSVPEVEAAEMVPVLADSELVEHSRPEVEVAEVVSVLADNEVADPSIPQVEVEPVLEDRYEADRTDSTLAAADEPVLADSGLIRAALAAVDDEATGFEVAPVPVDGDAGDGPAPALEAAPVAAPEPGLRGAGEDGAEATSDPEPVSADSDEGSAGGLFLNTGAGLGARELDVDDEDGG